MTELLLVLALRLELELLTLLLALEPEELLRLELLAELELVPTLRLELLELLPTLRLELELVLLGRSYEVPDCDDLAELLFTEREALERLEVAGATLFTADELLLLLTLRLDDELVFTLRLADELVFTLRLADELLFTLRLLLEPALDTLLEVVPDDCVTERFVEPEVCTLRLAVVAAAVVVLSPALEATVLSGVVLTLRLVLEPNAATRSEFLRLRLRSHPPALILRLGTNLSAW